MFFFFAYCAYDHLSLIRKDKTATLTPLGLKDPDGPTYRWDKNIMITGYGDNNLQICCGGIYDSGIEFILDMDSSKYRPADIVRAKAYVAQYVPAVLELDSQEANGWLTRFLQSKVRSAE